MLSRYMLMGIGFDLLEGKRVGVIVPSEPLAAAEAVHEMLDGHPHVVRRAHGMERIDMKAPGLGWAIFRTVNQRYAVRGFNFDVVVAPSDLKAVNPELHHDVVVAGFKELITY